MRVRLLILILFTVFAPAVGATEIQPPEPPGGGHLGLPPLLLLLGLLMLLPLVIVYAALAFEVLPYIVVFLGASYLNEYNHWGYWWCVLALIPAGIAAWLVKAVLFVVLGWGWKKISPRRHG